MATRSRILAALALPLLSWASGCGAVVRETDGQSTGQTTGECDGGPCGPCSTGDCVPAAPACTGEMGYPGAPIHRLSHQPGHGQIADLDGDGLLDLAVGNGEFVSVLLGEPGGDFGPRMDYQGPAEPFAAVDVDGDGWLDLLGVWSETVLVYKNHGDGTFAPADTFPEGGSGFGATTGDLDGDGAVDLVIATGGFGPDGALRVFFNDGTGGFSDPVVYATGDAISATGGLVTGDFDGDGAIDVAQADLFASSVRVYRNQGDGALDPPWDHDQKGSIRRLFKGDFNGDGRLDLLVGFADGAGLLANQGDGTFVSSGSDGQGPIDLLQDMDGDGIEDGLYGPAGSDSIVRVRRGAPDGTFGPGMGYQVERDITGVAAADLNGDGHGDLVTFLRGIGDEGNGVDVRFARADGSFDEPLEIPVPPGPASIAAADLNGDGRTDLVIASPTAKDQGVVVLFNLGEHTFSEPTALLASGAANAVATADLTGDGHTDILVAHGSAHVTLLAGNGDGSFAPPVDIPAGDSNRTIATGDLDGDGDIDIVTADGSRVSVLRNDGQGVFLPPETLVTKTTGSIALALADLDADGRLDIVVAGDTVNVLGTKGGEPFVLHETGLTAAYGSSIATGDLDGDGLSDIVVPRAGVGDLGLLRNEGDGSFLATFLESEGHPAGVRAADLDGDGDLDLAISHDLLGRATVLFNDGAGTFSPPAMYGAGQPAQETDSYPALVVANLDDDGRPDIAVLDAEHATLTLLLAICHE